MKVIQQNRRQLQHTHPVKPVNKAKLLAIFDLQHHHNRERISEFENTVIELDSVLNRPLLFVGLPILLLRLNLMLSEPTKSRVPSELAKNSLQIHFHQ